MSAGQRSLWFGHHRALTELLWTRKQEDDGVMVIYQVSGCDWYDWALTVGHLWGWTTYQDGRRLGHG